MRYGDGYGDGVIFRTVTYVILHFTSSYFNSIQFNSYTLTHRHKTSFFQKYIALYAFLPLSFSFILILILIQLHSHSTYVNSLPTQPSAHPSMSPLVRQNTVHSPEHSSQASSFR